MNKRVEEFLAKNIQSDNDNSKEAILIKAGLYDEISEYDPQNCTYHFVGKKPINVTDEEFEAIKNCLLETETHKRNILATIISIAAYCVFMIGFIAGTIIGQELSSWGSDFNISSALIVWGASAVCGISLLWFAEVLKLLQDIKNKLRSDE